MILLKYHALFVNFENCRLLQILGGALWVKMVQVGYSRWWKLGTDDGASGKLEGCKYKDGLCIIWRLKEEYDVMLGFLIVEVLHQVKLLYRLELCLCRQLTYYLQKT